MILKGSFRGGAFGVSDPYSRYESLPVDYIIQKRHITHYTRLPWKPV